MTDRTLRSIAWIVVTVVAVALASDTATAHVEYVVEGEGLRGSIRFLVGVLSDPTNALLFGAGTAGVLSTVAIYLVFDPFRIEREIFTDTLRSYEPYLPWMLRLSIGLPLVGAGFAGYLFTPAVTANARVIQVTLGFLLLFGFLSRAVAFAGLCVYAWVLVVEWPAPLLAVEYVPGFVAIVILGSGQPSFDGILRRLMMEEESVFHRFNEYNKLGKRLATRVGLTTDKTGVVLRLGIGFNFVYLGLTQKLMQPAVAMQVVEKYSLTSVVPVSPEMWVAGAGLAEIAVGLALAFGLFTRASAAVAFSLFTLTLFGLPDDPVVAHITLFGLSSAILVTGRGDWSVSKRIRKSIPVPGRPASEP